MEDVSSSLPLTFVSEPNHAREFGVPQGGTLKPACRATLSSSKLNDLLISQKSSVV